MRFIKAYVDNFIQRWQAKCPHDSKYVRYDVLEGDSPGCLVHWCYRCGAYSITYQVAGTRSEWRQPKATWATRTGI